MGSCCGGSGEGGDRGGSKGTEAWSGVAKTLSLRFILGLSCHGVGMIEEGKCGSAYEVEDFGYDCHFGNI